MDNEVQVGSRIGQLARHAMNYADDKIRKVVRGNEYEDLHNSLTSILSRATNTMASLEVNIETLQKAQQEYYKSLGDSDEKQQDANKKIVQTLEQLLELQDNKDRKDLFDKVFKRRKVTREEARRVIEYSKQMAKLTTDLSDSKHISPEVIIKQMQETLKDTRLDGKYRHEVLSDLQEFLQEEKLGNKELLDRIDNILKRDDRVDYNEIKPLTDVLDEVLAQIKTESSINDIVESLEDADLSDSGTHQRLENLVSLMTGIKSLEAEQAWLSEKLVKGIDDNEEEMSAMRQVLRRVADETVETKTLHTLNTLSHQFDRAILNTEQLEDALKEKELGKRFEMNPELVSKGKGLFSNILSGLMQMLGLGDLDSLLGVSDFIADNLGVALASIGTVLLGAKKLLGKAISSTVKVAKQAANAAKGAAGMGAGGVGNNDPNAKKTKTKTDVDTKKTKTEVKGKATTAEVKGTTETKVDTKPSTAKTVDTKMTTKTPPAPELKPGSIVDSNIKAEKIGSHKTKTPHMKGIKGGGKVGKLLTFVAGAVGLGMAGSALADEISDRRKARIEAVENGGELSQEDLPATMLDLANSIDQLNETLAKGVNFNGGVEQQGLSTEQKVAMATGGVAAIGATALGTKVMLDKAKVNVPVADVMPAQPATKLALENAGSVAPNTAKMGANASHMVAAEKGAFKTLAKGAGRAVPVLGNIAAWGLDAYEFATAESTAERKQAGTNIATSAVGAWAGAKAGAATGAAIGSIIPGAGTAVGGIIGGIGGSIAGAIGGSWIGEKISGLFMNPEDYIPDEAKKGGPLLEYYSGMNLLNDPEGPITSDEDKAKLQTYLNGLITPNSIKPTIDKAMADPDFKAIPADMKAEAFIASYLGGLQSVVKNFGLPEDVVNKFSDVVHKMLDPKKTTVSDTEHKARMDAANKIVEQSKQPTYWGYQTTGFPNRQYKAEDIALVSAYDETTKDVKFSNLIAEQGAKGLEVMKKNGASAADIRAAQTQLDNQRGLSLADFLALNKGNAISTLDIKDTKEKVFNEDGTVKASAADVNTIKGIDKVATAQQANLAQQDIDQLEKMADTANKKSIGAQALALSSKIGTWLGNQLPQAVVPLIGLNATLNIDNSRENDSGISFEDMVANDPNGSKGVNAPPGLGATMGIASTALGGGASGWGGIGGSPTASMQGGGSAIGDGDIDKSNMRALGKFGDVRALIEYGMQFIGKVEYSQTGPRDPKKGSADCSSFVKVCLEDAWGVKGVPGNSEAQFTWKKGRVVKYDELKPGDLMFFNHPAAFAKNRPIGISHVAFYIGNDEILHCSGRKGVNRMKMGGSYKRFFYAGKRLTESGSTSTAVASVTSAPGGYGTADLNSSAGMGSSPNMAFNNTGGVPVAPQAQGEQAVGQGTQGSGYTGALDKYIRQGTGEFGGNINGLNQQEMAGLAATLAQRESGGNQFIENKWGYLGLYQFGAAALTEVGLIDRKKYDEAIKQNPGIANGSDARAHKAFLANPSNWTIPGGKDAFLMDKSMQDRALATMMNKNKATMERKGIQFSSSADLAGMLLGAHLKGVGNAVKYKTKGVDAKDGLGTSISQYYALGSKAVVSGTGTPLKAATTLPDGQAPLTDTASATMLVTPQTLPSPKYALETQSRLKGEAQGSTVTNAKNTAMPIVIPPSKPADIGQQQPKTSIDDPQLLLATTQLFN